MEQHRTIIHGLDAEAFQSACDQLCERGYRPIRITGCDDAGTVRYAGILVRRGGNPWRMLQGVSASRLGCALDRFGHEGYRPLDMSAFPCGREIRFNMIWEQEAGPALMVHVAHTADEHRQMIDSLSSKRFRPRCIVPYVDNDGVERVAGIWERNSGPPCESRFGMTAEGVGRCQDTMTVHGFRPVRCVGYGTGSQARYAAIWERSPGYPSHVAWSIPADDLEAELSRRARMGMSLVEISSFCLANRLRYVLVWEREERTDRTNSILSTTLAPFMRKWGVPGLSVAVSHTGTGRAWHGLGYANPTTREAVTPATRFRVASVSKPITSTAIHFLAERGALSIDDHIFGEGKLLGTRFGTRPYGPWLREITVRHLLEHLAGGWGNDHTDPMFQRLGFSQYRLISWTLDNVPTRFPPGTRYAYSNFGYCLLGRVVEAASGQAYHAFVRRFLMPPGTSPAMLLAGRSPMARAPGEAVYRGAFPADPYAIRADRMDAHGGWSATPVAILDLIERLERQDGHDRLLQPSSLATMLTPSALRRPGLGRDGYAQGWSVDTRGTVWHDGQMPGTLSILIRMPSGVRCCAVCNAGAPGTAMPDEFHTAMRKALLDTSLAAMDWKTVGSADQDTIFPGGEVAARTLSSVPELAHLGSGLSLEGDPVGLKLGAQLPMVLDNANMDHCDPACYLRTASVPVGRP